MKRYNLFVAIIVIFVIMIACSSSVDTANMAPVVKPTKVVVENVETTMHEILVADIGETEDLLVSVYEKNRVYLNTKNNEGK